MIRIYEASKNKVRESSALMKNARGLLIDAYKPTKSEINKLSKAFSISMHDINQALDTESRPRIIDQEKYSMLIFTSAAFQKNRIRTVSFGIFICRKNIIIIRNERLPLMKRFEELSQEHKAKEIRQGAGYLAYLLLDFSFDNYFRIMDDVEDQINRLETKVLRTPDDSTVRKIFSLKKDLIYIHKSLTADREVISGIEKGYLKQVKDVNKYKYIYHDATELIDIESTYRDILSSTLEMYTSSVSNKLNDIMKKLTAMASFILIPTLISGIYGMNFNNMPEFGWKYGYGFALFLMALSVVIMYFYFKDKKWI